MHSFTILLVLTFTLSFGEAKDFDTLRHLKSNVSPDVQAKTVVDLIKRVAGSRAAEFQVIVDPTVGPPSRDTFHLISTDKNLVIHGTTGVAAAMGFYYFLKYHCGGQFTWAGQQTDLPDPLPQIASPGVNKTTPDQFRYYQNVCTVSYSFVWWDWARWEREIDWMAMQGINLPLAFTGQEAIFQRVYMAMGFTWADLQEDFGGPAFLAWARMGNIRGWGGPLPQTWINNRLILQHKILTRMRSLGMIPVLPGFAGHVPAAITRLYPNVNVTRLGTWAGFSEKYSATYLLDFHDPLFKKIGASFIQQMENEFGVDHIYNADTFNEMTPRSGESSYLASASKAVYEAMVAGDPQAIWLMQSWLFQFHNFWNFTRIKALLSGVPLGKMIILDLQSEVSPTFTTTDSYFGQPFIWCMLHMYGGNMELYGDLEAINVGPFYGRRFPNSTMVGTGITPEGIFQNEIIYEFMNENSWRTEPRNISDWVSDFQAQRYGMSNGNTERAWMLLQNTVYDCTDGRHEHSFDVTITTRPRLSPPLNPRLWYLPALLYEAWDNLVLTARTLNNSKLFRYDLVDVTRNSLQVLSTKFYNDIITAYQQKNIKLLLNVSKQMTDLLSDIDTLLGSDEHFLLGKWLEDAKAFAIDANETLLYEYNARNQITLWGPNGEILDYANKQWAGLISGYYLLRWELFVDQLAESLIQNKTFNSSMYDQEVFDVVEKPFTLETNEYPTTPVGDSVQIALYLHQKYRAATKSGFFKHLYDQSKTERTWGMRQAESRAASQWNRPVLHSVNNVN